MLQRAHGSLDKLRRSRRTDWSVEADTSDGVIVKVSYAATYEHGARTEDFTYRIQGRRAEVGALRLFGSPRKQPRRR